MHRRLVLAAALTAACASFGFADAQEWDPRGREGELNSLLNQSQDAITAFRLADPSLSTFFTQAFGYAVFPSIKKGGFGLGAARGKGILYRSGQPAAQVTLTQVSLGLQAGGKVFREILFFRDQAAYDAFAKGEFDLSGQASATLANAGAADRTPYSQGVAVFVLDKAGVMAEASVAGQGFRVEPLSAAPVAASPAPEPEAQP